MYSFAVSSYVSIPAGTQIINHVHVPFIIFGHNGQAMIAILHCHLHYNLP